MAKNEEVFVLAPKGIASLALMQSGLVATSEDPRIDGFWSLFVSDMKRFGYLVEEDGT